LSKVTGNDAALPATLTAVDYFIRTGDDSFRDFAPR
jgi:hypothetical protein